MKILGLIGSYRKLGNTEVLVKEALMEAQRHGAEVDMLRLTDLRIEPCKGCMACAFKRALKHFSLAVLPSGPRFLRERDEIEKRARKYRGFSNEQ